MEDLINEFNEFFKRHASIIIVGDSLEITIDSQTLILSLPRIVGAQARDSSQLS
jgi:hypothetical protein